MAVYESFGVVSSTGTVRSNASHSAVGMLKLTLKHPNRSIDWKGGGSIFGNPKKSGSPI
jgi:hypothetical protein